MEVSLPPELEAQIKALAQRQGKDPAVVAGELLTSTLEHRRILEKKLKIRATLEKRWGDYKSGKVEPLDGEEVRREMKARTQAQRDRRG